MANGDQYQIDPLRPRPVEGTPMPGPMAAPEGGAAPAPGGNVFQPPPGMTGGAPQPAGPGGMAGMDPQMQQQIVSLLQRAAQPRMQGPQVSPEVMQAAQPMPTPQKLTGTLFGLIMDHVQHAKSLQIAHASQRIQGISNAITTAYEGATAPDGTMDEAKAKQLFMNSFAVKSLMSKEGQKDMKQMEKLLQMDFLNPEKKRTVWHEALENTAKLIGAEKAMKGIKELFGKHKDAMQQELTKQGQAQQGAQRGRELAENMFASAQPAPPPDLKEIAPMVAAMSRSEAQAALEQQKEQSRFEIQRRNQEFASSVKAIKDPRLRKIGEAYQYQIEHPEDPDGARKLMDQAHQGYLASKEPTQTMNYWIHQLVTGTPEEKAIAKTEIDKSVGLQMAMLQNRGMAFGMGRLYQYTDDDGVMGPKGATVVLNGFQLDEQMRASGGHFTLVGPISPNIMLGVQQLLGKNKGIFDSLRQDMGVWDNATDRAIFAKVMRANPEVAGMDVTTLGVWLDQNLTGQLSTQGQRYMRNLLIGAEVLGTSRRLTGQPATGITTQLILAMLPGEKTPGKQYGLASLDALTNYLDGLTGASILGQATKLDLQKKAKAGAKLSDKDIQDAIRQAITPSP